MTSAAPRVSLITPSTVIAAFCGLLLVISVLLPWLSPKDEIAAIYSSSSGVKTSSLIALTGIAGGLLAIGASFIPVAGLKKFLHIIIGLAAVGVFAFLLFKGILPFRSSVVMNYVNIGTGVFLYGLAALALLFVGLAEKSIIAPASRQWAPARSVTQPPQPVVTAPPTYAIPVRQPPPTKTPPPAAPRVPAFCGSCGQPVKPNVAFCSSCGQPLARANQVPAAPVEPVCHRCGRICSTTAAFCPACGARLGSGQV